MNMIINNHSSLHNFRDGIPLVDMFRNKQLQLNVNLENIQTIYFIFNLSLQH
jgi:hypothetical protein